MMKFIIMLGLVLSPASSFATGVFSMGTQSGGPTRTYPTIPIYFDINVSQQQGTLKGGALNTNQSVLVFQTGATFAVGTMFFLGLTYDYRTMSQLSETSSSDGNQSGKREFLAPVVGARFYNFVLKVDYQTTGDYKLDRTNAAGLDQSYISPKGYRASFLIDLYRGVSAQIVYETVTFQQGYVGGAMLAPYDAKLDVTSYGLGLAYAY